VDALPRAVEDLVELLASLPWVLNEKRILERAGLAAVQPLFHAAPEEPAALAAWVGQARAALGL
jgi:hypothetical protein